MDSVKIIECPRDAWQGLTRVIPTEEKIAYLRLLLRAGFRHIDAVSFVSSRHVPQEADSEAVMAGLMAGEPPNVDVSRAPGAEIIGIVVNERGLRRAMAAPGITTVGYPYSLSELFTRQNAGMSQSESRELVRTIQQAVENSGAGGRRVVVYISMAFGNNYGEPWQAGMVPETVEWLGALGIRSVSLADTVGKARPEDIGRIFQSVKPFTPAMEIGVHLHSRVEGAREKILAAYDGGCRRFDSALTGLGGCPFAGDALVGNIATETLISALGERGADTGLRPDALAAAVQAAESIKAQYGPR